MSTRRTERDREIADLRQDRDTARAHARAYLEELDTLRARMARREREHEAALEAADTRIRELERYAAHARICPEPQAERCGATPGAAASARPCGRRPAPPTAPPEGRTIEVAP